MTRTTILTALALSIITGCDEAVVEEGITFTPTQQQTAADREDDTPAKAPKGDVSLISSLELGLYTLETEDGEWALGGLPTYLDGEELLPTFTVAVYFGEVESGSPSDCIVRFVHPAHQPVFEAAWVADAPNVLYGVTLTDDWRVQQDTCTPRYGSSHDFDAAYFQDIGLAAGITPEIDEASLGPALDFVPASEENFIGGMVQVGGQEVHARGATLALKVDEMEIAGPSSGDFGLMTDEEMIHDGQLKDGFYMFESLWTVQLND